MKPVSRTAFYCAGGRALDARKPRPACGDQYAERFMDDEAWKAFEPFRRLTGPNISNATRHRIIDDLLRDRLADHHDLRIVIIGAGFDSRAFRLKGGRWLEVDEPQLFAWKEPRLPSADSPNPLTRVAVDFSTERLADRLAEFADPGPVAIVVEGVLMYLGETQIRELLGTLRRLYPQGDVICDVMTRAFFEKFGRAVHQKLVDLGAKFQLPERPHEAIFAEEHYAQSAHVSIQKRAAELGQMPLFLRLYAWFDPVLQNGYSVRVFTPE
jgi:methyltransferase (TIGR00027 family)